MQTWHFKTFSDRLASMRRKKFHMTRKLLPSLKDYLETIVFLQICIWDHCLTYIFLTSNQQKQELLWILARESEFQGSPSEGQEIKKKPEVQLPSCSPTKSKRAPLEVFVLLNHKKLLIYVYADFSNTSTLAVVVSFWLLIFSNLHPSIVQPQTFTCTQIKLSLCQACNPICDCRSPTQGQEPWPENRINSWNRLD